MSLIAATSFVGDALSMTDNVGEPMVPPRAPSFTARHSDTTPGLPAGKAGLRPQRRVACPVETQSDGSSAANRIGTYVHVDERARRLLLGGGAAELAVEWKQE